MSEEEYITNENDPHSVEKITENNSIRIEENEETIEFDKVFETVRTKITDFSNYDHMMEEKVLDSLRKGKLRK